MSLQIKPEDLEKIKEILNEHYPHATVWAYGSRVNGTAHEGSDLDLVVRDFGVPKRNLAVIRAAFSESNIPLLIDLHYWGDLPESFQKEILKQYVIL